MRPEPDRVGDGRVVLLAVSLLGLPISLGAVELSGRFEIEPRGFTQSPAHPGQRRHGLSLAVQPEIHHAFGDGRQSLLFTPFLRVDTADHRRTHFDVRELLYQRVFDSAELRAGIGRVFWGVTESRHLVDVVNQTDAVRDVLPYRSFRASTAALNAAARARPGPVRVNSSPCRPSTAARRSNHTCTRKSPPPAPSASRAPHRRPGSASSTVNPSGLSIAEATFASHRFGATPIEHVTRGPTASRSYALMRRPTSSARSRAPSTQHSSSTEHTASIGSSAFTAQAIRRCTRT